MRKESEPEGISVETPKEKKDKKQKLSIVEKLQKK